jgi:hypothetical protein
MHKNNPFQRYNYFSNEHYTSNSKQTNILIQIGMLMKGNNMPPGGVGSSSSPTGGAVVGRGGRPSPEMLRGSGALPMRESRTPALRLGASQTPFASADSAS